MRVVVVVVAALLTLGLAAFGIVATQNAAGPAALLALATRIISPTQTATAVPTPAPTVEAAPTRIALAPVTQLSDASATTPSAAPAAASAPTLLAQNATPAAMPTGSSTPPPAAAAPAPGASTPPAKTAIPACNNPNALGLSRVVEIDTTGGPAFGTEHFKQYDFLRDKEVVFT